MFMRVEVLQQANDKNSPKNKFFRFFFTQMAEKRFSMTRYKPK